MTVNGVFREGHRVCDWRTGEFGSFERYDPDDRNWSEVTFGDEDEPRRVPTESLALAAGEDW